MSFHYKPITSMNKIIRIHSVEVHCFTGKVTFFCFSTGHVLLPVLGIQAENHWCLVTVARRSLLGLISSKVKVYYELPSGA